MPGNQIRVKAAKPRREAMRGLIRVRTKTSDMRWTTRLLFRCTTISDPLAATSSCHDLPCHRRALSIAFYFRLSPRQPRATLKTKMNGGLCGPPFIEARVFRRAADRNRRLPLQISSISRLKPRRVRGMADADNRQSHLTAALQSTTSRHGQETRNQSQRRIRLFQRLL